MGKIGEGLHGRYIMEPIVTNRSFIILYMWFQLQEPHCLIMQLGTKGLLCEVRRLLRYALDSVLLYHLQCAAELLACYAHKRHIR